MLTRSPASGSFQSTVKVMVLPAITGSGESVTEDIVGGLLVCMFQSILKFLPPEQLSTALNFMVFQPVLRNGLRSTHFVHPQHVLWRPVTSRYPPPLSIQTNELSSISTFAEIVGYLLISSM